MKTNRLPSLSLRYAIYLFILCSLFIPLSNIAQTTFQVNGRTLYKTGDFYYALSNNDTLHVDTKFITIKFKPQAEQAGKLKVTGNYGLQYIGTSSNIYNVFKITGTPVYPQLILDLNLLEEVDQTILSYAGKYMTDKDFPNDPGNQYVYVNVDDAWWVGTTYESNPAAEYLNLRGAWGEYTTGDPGISIGIIDTGNDWLQTDMPSDNMLGKNFLTGTYNTYPDYSIEVNSHGTKLTSIICSKTNNNLDIFGVAGGWQNDGNGVVPIMVVNGSVPVGGGNFGPSSALTPLCIDWAVQQGARVINMSFGWLGLSEQDQQSIKTAIDNAMSSNGHDPVVCIASAGNYNQLNNSGVVFPASYEPVIAVGGVDINHTRWDHGPDGKSSFGPELDFVTSYQAYFNQGNTPSGASSRLGLGGGTSFSAAMLTGVVSLMLSVNPCLTPAQVFEALKASCYKTTQYTFTNGWNINVGYGFPNAKKAIEAALGEDTYTLQTNETWTGTRFFRGDVIIPVGKKLTLDGATVKFNTNAGITLQGSGSLLEIINDSKLTNVCNNMWKGISMVLSPNSPPNPFANQDIYINNSTIEYAINALNVPYGVKVIAKNNTRFKNNTLSAFFNAAYYKNLSWFENCTFENNEEHLDPDHAQYMVKMLQNTGAAFYGCNFINNIPASLIKKHGIYAYSSKFTVAGYCSNPSITPCPEGSIVYSSFSNFDYGVYALFATNGWKVERTNFTNNNCGIYTSSGQAAKMLKNNFMIPSNQDPDPRGAYFNNSSGFHIEGNTFTCAAVTHADEVGLYLRNTGPTQNYVYNNAFTNLFRGSVADGENRHATTATGLCYKCNYFSNNAYDIDIVRDVALPLTNIYGISRYQGLPSAGSASTNKDTLAASNEFSINPYQYNIHNINNPSNYYYQQFKTPAYLKIIPNPVLGISTFQNTGTTYNKTLVCKSWINSGGSIGQDLAAKSYASSNAEAADLQLVNTVDGGNTTNLTFDIIGSTPPEALTLLDELLQKSPYLSDTAMKSVIEQENVLPNAMVRDILTANPQAAKSEEIMSKLDDRWEPMPDYMKEEIETGITIIGGREQLEAKRDGWLQQESFLTNRIISTYLGDTVNPDAINELKAFLQNENTIQSGFVLADICLQRGDYSGSNQAINSLQSNFTLSQFESQQAADYLALNTILAGLQANAIELGSVDSIHAIPLLSLYQSGDNTATAFARDILIASGLLSYQEPINIGDNEKSLIAQLPPVKPATSAKRSSEHLSIFPNPATTYTILEYALPANASNSSVGIYTNYGVVVWKQEIKRAKDQLIIDLNSIPSGSYIVSLQSGNQTVASKPLSVTK